VATILTFREDSWAVRLEPALQVPDAILKLALVVLEAEDLTV